MLHILRRLPSWASSRLLTVLIPLVFVYQFLLGSLRGVFLLSLGLYWLLATFGESPPLSPGQLAILVSELSTETTTALATTLITVIGFLVAFHTASVNWKDQARTTLQIAVADEIENFYDEVAQRCVQARLYAARVVEEVTRLRSPGWKDYTVLEILMTDAPSFRETRTRLAEMSVEVFRIAGKHHALLAPIGGTLEALHDCEVKFGEITSNMWFRIPTVHDDAANPAASFADDVDLEKWTNFVEVCDRNYDYINGLAGGVRGRLLGPLAQLSISSVLTMAKPAQMREAFELIRRV